MLVFSSGTDLAGTKNLRSLIDIVILPWNSQISSSVALLITLPSLLDQMNLVDYYIQITASK
jgi:hypothetical protein